MFSFVFFCFNWFFLNGESNSLLTKRKDAKAQRFYLNTENTE